MNPDTILDVICLLILVPIALPFGFAFLGSMFN